MTGTPSDLWDILGDGVDGNPGKWQNNPLVCPPPALSYLVSRVGYNCAELRPTVRRHR